jgi:nucleotide-binding universal stress UspA family protein
MLGRGQLGSVVVATDFSEGAQRALVVAEPAKAPYRRPLVAVDMSQSSRLALQLASRLQLDDVIDVLHSIAPVSDLAESGFVPDIGRFHADIERNARAELSAFLGAIERSHAKWNITLRMGDPRDVILQEAKRRENDLIVLGANGKTQLPHVLIGSVAEAVLRAATCDVLVARLPRADFRLPGP